LVEAVRSGRRDEFESFDWEKDIPDPQAVSTFEQSRLKWHERSIDRHAMLLKFYRRLIELRKSRPGFTSRSGMRVRCLAEKNVLLWHRTFKKSHMQCVMNFAGEEQQLKLYSPQTRWNRILDSAQTTWLGPGSAVPEVVQSAQIVTAAPTSIIVFEAGEERPTSGKQQPTGFSFVEF
jgi:maltooligosyltrehalose trehalohydrolase